MKKIDDKFKEEMVGPPNEVDKFDKHGITDDYLIGDKLMGELEAEEDGKKLWKIQQDARKDAHKLKGDYPAEKVDHGDIVVNINATPIEKKKT